LVIWYFGYLVFWLSGYYPLVIMSVGYCGKGCLYFYNLIYLGISGVMMYLSVLFVYQWGDYSSLIASTYTIVPCGIIFGFAIILLISGIIGMCGNYKENRCTLGVFFCMLMVVFTFELVAGILVYVKDDDIKVSLKENLYQSFTNYYDSSPTARKSFDKMQRSLECCGVNGPMDWGNSSMEIPSSCCAHPEGEKCYTLPINLYEKGCWGILERSYADNIRYITGVFLAFAIFQLFGLILTIYMLVILKRKLRYKRIIESPTTKT